MKLKIKTPLEGHWPPGRRARRRTAPRRRSEVEDDVEEAAEVGHAAAARDRAVQPVAQLIQQQGEAQQPGAPGDRDGGARPSAKPATVIALADRPRATSGTLSRSSGGSTSRRRRASSTLAPRPARTRCALERELSWWSLSPPKLTMRGAGAGRAVAPRPRRGGAGGRHSTSRRAGSPGR